MHAHIANANTNVNDDEISIAKIIVTHLYICYNFPSAYITINLLQAYAATPIYLIIFITNQ